MSKKIKLKRGTLESIRLFLGGTYAVYMFECSCGEIKFAVTEAPVELHSELELRETFKKLAQAQLRVATKGSVKKAFLHALRRLTGVPKEKLKDPECELAETRALELFRLAEKFNEYLLKVLKFYDLAEDFLKEG